MANKENTYKIIIEQIIERMEQMPAQIYQYYKSDKWKYEQHVIQQYMIKLFQHCKMLCFQLFPQYDYYLEAIFQECQLVFTCKETVVDLYGQLLPDGNIQFNQFPILEVAKLNTDKEKIYKIIKYKRFFQTIPHQLAHIIDIAINGRPKTQQEVHRESWNIIFNTIMEQYK